MIAPYKTELECELPRRPYATQGLIVVNVVIFTFTQSLEMDELQLFFLNWGFSRFEFSAVSLLTAMFLHADFFHLAGNMLSLHIYGPGVEAGYGPGRYLAYYLGFGALGSLLHTVLAPESASDIPLVGASGAIAGVMGAFFVMHPRASVRHCVIFLPQIRFSLPAWVVLGEWFLSQTSAARNDSGSGIAFLAHVGGFAAGFVVTTYLKYGGDFQRALARAEAHKTIDAASNLPADVNPRLGLDLIKESLSRSPDDPNLRYWAAIMAWRAGRTDEARTFAETILGCIPVENKPGRLNGHLLKGTLVGPSAVSANAVELAALLVEKKRHMAAEEILRTHLDAHPEMDKREAMVMRYKRAEILARHLGREDEALEIFEEVARGPKNDPLVQGAQFEARGIRHRKES